MIKIKPKDSETMDMPIGESSMSKDKKSIKIYPHLCLKHEYFPEVKKWEVGKEYEITLKLKMTGLSISKFQNDSEFDILEYEIDSEEKEEE
jgi:hypothetical protein